MGPGNRSADLRIASNADDSPIDLFLNGIGLLSSLNVTRVQFGPQQVGTASPGQPVTLTNVYGPPLDAVQVGLQGANPGDFAVVGDLSSPGSLPAGQSRSIQVLFRPTSTGPRSAVLVFNNGRDGQQTVALTGTGTAPAAGQKGLVLPVGAVLTVATVDGAPVSGSKIMVSIGQKVGLKLQLQFPNGTLADVTTDPGSHFTAYSAHGGVSGADVWSPVLQDAGKTVVLSGTWQLPHTGWRWTGTVTVMVRTNRRLPWR